MRNAKILEPLLWLVRSWGGHFEFVRHVPLIHMAPFTSSLGADHEQKVIYIGPSASIQLGGIVHECGHVFASREAIKRQDEFDFFGWEYLLAKKVELLTFWYDSMDNYCVYNEIEFGDMTREEQSDLIEERVAYARRLGIVSDEEPLNLRKGEASV